MNVEIFTEKDIIPVVKFIKQYKPLYFKMAHANNVNHIIIIKHVKDNIKKINYQSYSSSDPVCI